MITKFFYFKTRTPNKTNLSPSAKLEFVDDKKINEPVEKTIVQLDSINKNNELSELFQLFESSESSESEVLVKDFSDDCQIL